MADITEDLFILENDVPVLNPVARLVKEYKAIIERDKGSPGDSQGRKKLLATRELAFVVLFVNLKSAYNRNYDEQSRTAELTRGLELPPDWKIDDKIKDAMKEYSKTQVTPSSAMLVSTRNALFEARNIVTFLEKRIKKTMKMLQEADLLTDIEMGTEDQVDALMDKALKDIEILMKYSKQITENLATLDVLEKKYVKEIAELNGKANKEVNYHELED